MRRKTDSSQLRYGTFIIAVVLIVLVLLISCAVALYVSRETSENLNTYIIELLSLYSEGIGNGIIGEIDALEINSSSLMSLSPYLSDDAIEEALRNIVSTSRSTIMNAVLIRGGGEVLSPYYPVSYSYLEPLLSQVSGYDQSPIIQSTHSKLLEPYEEPLGRATILPYLVIDAERSLAILFDINITNLLVEQTAVQKNRILSSDIAFDVNIYDAEGRLLETSGNRALKYHNTLAKDDIYDNFTLKSETLQLYSYITEDAIWMMKKDSGTGLSVAIRASVDVVNEAAGTTTSSILIIAALCLLSLLMIIFIGIRLLRNYQIWTKLQDESRFETLQSKMNPHLLFNTLDSIAYAAEEDNMEDVLLCIKSLAYILQTSLRDNSIEGPLIHQIKYIFSYINLQKIRYEDKFTFNLEEDLGDYSIEDLNILRYSVQPIIENCFKHSVYQGVKHVLINVRYELDDGNLKVTVRNTGSALSEEDLEKLKDRLAKTDLKDTKHIGLMSIDRRIKLRYGKSYGIDLPYDKEYFTVIVRVPLLEN